MDKEARAGSTYIIPREEPSAISRADFFSSEPVRKFNDRAILEKSCTHLLASEGAADVLHNCNKVENRVACPEYVARNSHEVEQRILEIPEILAAIYITRNRPFFSPLPAPARWSPA